MAIFFSPRINSDDYDAFLRIPNLNMPRTFDEWAYECGEADLQRAKGGIRVVGIEVNPDDFIEYLGARGTAASRHELNNFAFHEARRLQRHIE